VSNRSDRAEPTVPTPAHRTSPVGADRVPRVSPVGQQHPRDGSATILRRGGEDPEQSTSRSPTEVTTDQPQTAGACRRRAYPFADRDRANHQVMGSGTLTCSFPTENSGGSERGSWHQEKTQMIPYRYPMVASLGVRERRRGVRPPARNSLLISMTSATGLPAQLLARKRL
jgi:hypothetical protein